MHERSQYCKFEGEEDRNHHGNCPNPLFSNSPNLGMSFQTGAGMGLRKQGTGGHLYVLRNAHANTEMNISQFGKEEKKTRIKRKRMSFFRPPDRGLDLPSSDGEKFGNIIGDQVSSVAFRKELKAVIGKEYVKKRMERREELTKARLKQMNRKPWLQKRVQ